MNKIYSSLSLILLLLTLGSCDSMFDNEIPPHDLVGDNGNNYPVCRYWMIILMRRIPGRVVIRL